MSQSEYELIHSAQVQRDKKKLDVLAPSNTTQFLIRDHNRQSTPSSIATPTPTHQTGKFSRFLHRCPMLCFFLFDISFFSNQYHTKSPIAPLRSNIRNERSRCTK